MWAKHMPLVGANPYIYVQGWICDNRGGLLYSKANPTEQNVFKENQRISNRVSSLSAQRRAGIIPLWIFYSEKGGFSFSLLCEIYSSRGFSNIPIKKGEW